MLIHLVNGQQGVSQAGERPIMGVSVTGVCSNFMSIITGTPQGSLLGPMLFNIFINDLSCVPSVSLQLYADETTAFLSDVSPTILQFSIDKDLQTLSLWFGF